MATATLSDAARRKMRTLEKSREKVRFSKDNRLDTRTFNELRDGIPKASHVVARIEAALKEPEPKIPTPDAVKRIVAVKYGTYPEALEIKSRKKVNEEARMIAAMLLHREVKMTKADVARMLGYGDHTSVLAAINGIEARLSVEVALQERVAEIREKLREAA